MPRPALPQNSHVTMIDTIGDNYIGLITGGIAQMAGKEMDGVNINKSIFEKLPAGAKLDAIFNCLERMNDEIEGIKIQLAKRRKIDTAISAIGGVIGGMLAMMGKWTIFKG